MAVAIPEKGLPSREALREFLDKHEYSLGKSAYEAKKEGKKLVFLFLDWEPYGDRTYYYCEDDGKVYSDYFSIGD